MEYLGASAWIAMLLVFMGSFVQTAIGFGLAVVASPLLFLISPDYVPSPICLVALFISVLNAMKHREYFDWRLKNGLNWAHSGIDCGWFAADVDFHAGAGAVAWLVGAVCGGSKFAATAH